MEQKSQHLSKCLPCKQFITYSLSYASLPFCVECNQTTIHFKTWVPRISIHCGEVAINEWRWWLCDEDVLSPKLRVHLHLQSRETMPVSLAACSKPAHWLIYIYIKGKDRLLFIFRTHAIGFWYIHGLLGYSKLLLVGFTCYRLCLHTLCHL